MIDIIIKRDGRKVPFDPQKITDAIMKAFRACNSAKTIKTAEQLTRQVLDELEKNECIGEPSVEEVQDTVERVLIENGFVRTAKSYILYRAERSRVREMNTRLMRIYEDITNKAAIDSDIKRENANINGDTAMGAMLKYGSEGAKQFNLMFVLKPEHAEAHRNGDIHIHDMDFLTLTTTCSDANLSEAQWASGCGDIILSDGSITNSATWNYASGRAPRTAVGVQADGTMIFYTADGRQSGYSGGLTEMDLAEELQRQGCVWAVNLDGGGSTTFALRVPGSSGLTVINSPSEGSLRSCAAFILLVTDSDTADGAAERLALKEDGLVVLAGSSVTLGDVAALDGSASTVSSRVSDAVFTSEDGLGSFNGGVYTAGSQAGTDTISIESPSLGISGTAQIHVVTALSDLTVTREGSSSAVSSLSLEPGETVSLTATGTYWSRSALRTGSAGVTWAVTGNVGTITQDGVFTASSGGTSGTITATAGGVTKTISVSLNNVHTDVPADHWAYTAVEYCYDNGIVSGISATEFGTNYSISRKDFVLMLYGALDRPAVSGSSGFSDVADDAYYADAVTWASSNGLVSGVSEGCFAPDDLVTREQAATILHQAMPLLGLSSSEADLSVLDQFADQGQIADYARPHMAALVSQGLMSGTGTGLNPKGNLTRAEMATLLYRLLTTSPDSTPEEPDSEPEVNLDPDAALTLDVTEYTLASTQTLQLNATLTGGTGTVTWSTSDATVATVSSDGTVTNVYAGVGTPSVTITASCGSLTASAVIQCSPADVVGQVTATTLNVRSGPGTDYTAISSLKSGAQVVVLDTSTPGWYQVLFSSGGTAVTGWNPRAKRRNARTGSAGTPTGSWAGSTWTPSERPCTCGGATTRRPRSSTRTRRRRHGPMTASPGRRESTSISAGGSWQSSWGSSPLPYTLLGRRTWRIWWGPGCPCGIWRRSSASLERRFSWPGGRPTSCGVPCGPCGPAWRHPAGGPTGWPAG